MSLRTWLGSTRVACALSLGIVLTSACEQPVEPPVTPMPTCMLMGLDFSHASVGVTTGVSRDVYVELRRDWNCGELPLTLTTSGSGAIEALPEGLVFGNGVTRLPLVITGVGEGTLTITAVAENDDVRGEAVLEVAITGASLPACEGDGAGRVVAGGELRVTGGTLEGAHVALAEGASRDDRYHVDDFDVSIACAPDQLPEGYVALGPAVSFESDGVYRFQREIDFGIPIQLSLLPSHANRAHVEVAYVGPGVPEARVVPIANPIFEGDGADGVLRFQAPRLGTYQAITRAEGPATVARPFNYRGIVGVSMGGSGSGRVGIANPEVFDYVAPLGGPTDWQYMLEYIRRYHLGGFCTEEERASGADCSATTQERAPARGELYEHVQHFENWWYEDEYDGQGGTFDRAEYVEIFRDLAAMFGNANTDGSADENEPNVTPPGVPDSDRFLPASERCAESGRRTVLPEPTEGDTDPATGYFDDEYNPEGQYAVITFCDGGEVPGDTGRWSADAAPRTPVEVAYAVDVNGNGIRDGGEPVIRNGHEPYDDVGRDGLPSAMEPGYDALTNPDPSGDDYDFQYNPLGTEGNWDWDENEPWDDFGLDGVLGTAQLAEGGYDNGEGDGVFTRARGAQRMIDSSPRQMVRTLDDATLARFDVLADGGVRDLFNWAVMGHHTMGGLAARGLPVRFYNGHAALHLDGRDTFTFQTVPFDEIGRFAMVRYGSIDATEEEKMFGDGGHVGTINQITHRFFSALAMMDRGWGGGDRRIVRDELCRTLGPTCDHVNSIAIDFTSPTTGRTGPVSIVLPPGYFDPEHADETYPVVYFLHGYGMEPSDLLVTGLLLWNYMNLSTLPASQRFQKAIFVFPDGRCRNQECVNGTFYTDAPASTPNGALMETFLLDVVEYVDATYRTRAPAVVDVMQ